MSVVHGLRRTIGRTSRIRSPPVMSILSLTMPAGAASSGNAPAACAGVPRGSGIAVDDFEEVDAVQTGDVTDGFAAPESQQKYAVTALSAHELGGLLLLRASYGVLRDAERGVSPSAAARRRVGSHLKPQSAP
jgi:hypothetical protein